MGCLLLCPYVLRMILKSIALSNVRNHGERHVEFAPGVNYILGPNGSGKTTILEAIHMLFCGRSFRTPHLRHLIQEGRSQFQIEAWISSGKHEETLQFSYNGTLRKILHNESPLEKLSDLVGILPGITLTPYDIHLIDGSPAHRRQFLDLYLSQLSPSYLFQLSRYHRALEQRNAALKQRASSAIVASFDEIMIQAGEIISSTRNEALAQLQESIFSERLHIVFHSSPFLPQYKKEKEIGWTLSGPHKEDFTIFLQNQPAKSFASEGQKRSAVIAVRLAQFHHLRQHIGSHPLLLIDDAGLGFDSQRLCTLLEAVTSFSQVILSSAIPFTAKGDVHTIEL